MEEEALQRLISHWRRNDEPPNPHEYDAIISICEADGSHGRFEVYGAIKWNPVREHYEIEPITEVSDEVYVEAALQLEPRRYYELRRKLRGIGVKHLVRIENRTKPRAERPSTLPASLFPTVISR